MPTFILYIIFDAFSCIIYLFINFSFWQFGSSIPEDSEGGMFNSSGCVLVTLVVCGVCAAQAGTYLPQSYLIHEEMIVTERMEHVDQLGYFIYNLCRGKDTYKLQRRDRILGTFPSSPSSFSHVTTHLHALTVSARLTGMQKREALNCHKIRHFENTFVVETRICEL